MNTEYNLKPCSFCGAIPTIKWEAWKEISETSGIYILEAYHRKGCFIRMMNGTNSTGRMSACSANLLAETWNTRFKEDEE